MVLIGIVKDFNGSFGTIITEDNTIVDFDARDIEPDNEIKVGDYVVFRLEVRFPNIKLARNISPTMNPSSRQKDT